MTMCKGRTNSASANTRAIRKALAGKVSGVTVKSFDYCGGAGEVSAKEMEPLMLARAILVAEGGFTVTEIKTFSALEPRFFVERTVTAMA